MSESAVSVEHVFKKFRKGELHKSLRDFIPALTRYTFKKNQNRDNDPREFWALKDISFQVKKGESFGIIGHNGAGKSTILKLLSNIMKPTNGSVQVHGKLSALIEIGAGFHKDLTGRENIYLNGTILGMSKNEIKRKFDEIVDFSGLEEFIDTPVKRYSTGMYARLGFSVAAHLDPDIFLVDEVLSVGDFLFQKKGVEKMNSIMKSGATVIFISHNLRAVADLCQRSILLDHGKIVKNGLTNEVIKHYMEMNLINTRNTNNKDVFISRVVVRDKETERIQFKSGQKIWIEIEVFARVECHKLAIVLDLQDEDCYHILDTSTERLIHKSFSLKAGEKGRCAFELNAYLAPGTYYFDLTVYRYDMEKAYDSFKNAGMIHVSSDKDVRGVVNLDPKVIPYDLSFR